MKQFFALLLLLLLPFGGVKAQSFTYDEIEKVVIAYNSALPLSMGPSVELTSMAISPKELTVEMTLFEWGDAVVKQVDENARELAKSIIASNDETREYFESIAQLGIALPIVVHGESTGEKAELCFSPEEILEFCQMEVDPLESLRQYVTQQQATLPIRLNESMEISKVFLSDAGFLEMVYGVDEALLAALDPSAMRSTLSENIVQDISLMTVAVLCQGAGFGLAFVWKSMTSEEKIRIAFTSDDLLELLSE